MDYHGVGGCVMGYHGVGGLYSGVVIASVGLAHKQLSLCGVAQEAAWSC